MNYIRIYSAPIILLSNVEKKKKKEEIRVSNLLQWRAKIVPIETETRTPFYRIIPSKSIHPARSQIPINHPPSKYLQLIVHLHPLTLSRTLGGRSVYGTL